MRHLSLVTLLTLALFCVPFIRPMSLTTLVWTIQLVLSQLWLRLRLATQGNTKFTGTRLDRWG